MVKLLCYSPFPNNCQLLKTKVRVNSGLNKCSKGVRQNRNWNRYPPSDVCFSYVAGCSKWISFVRRNFPWRTLCAQGVESFVEAHSRLDCKQSFFNGQIPVMHLAYEIQEKVLQKTHAPTYIFTPLFQKLYSFTHTLSQEAWRTSTLYQQHPMLNLLMTFDPSLSHILLANVSNGLSNRCHRCIKGGGIC